MFYNLWFTNPLFQFKRQSYGAPVRDNYRSPAAPANSYAAPAAAAPAGESYGSPAAAPIAAEDSYGAPADEPCSLEVILFIYA